MCLYHARSWGHIDLFLKPGALLALLNDVTLRVQVRGYSVVIGAVEAAITEHPLVSTAIVMTEGAEGSMDKKLVAYIVPDSWEKVR